MVSAWVQGAGREVRVSTLLLGEGQCRKEPFRRSTEASSPHSCQGNMDMDTQFKHYSLTDYSDVATDV